MLKAVLLLIIAMCSIQGGATIAKGLFPALGPSGATADRLFFASIVLWLIFKPWKVSLTKKQFKRLFFYGICLGLMNLTFYFALVRIPLGIAVALEFSGPLAVAVFTSKKKFDFIWAVLAGLGIYLIVPDIRSETTLDSIGILFALTAGAFWAGYILFGKKAGSDLSGGHAATWGMTFAALVVIPFGVASAGLKLFSPHNVFIGLIVALLSSAIPYTLEMISLKKMPTKTFGVLMSLEPAIAAFAGLLFLSEALLPLQWLAILCIILSSLGSSLTAE